MKSDHPGLPSRAHRHFFYALRGVTDFATATWSQSLELELGEPLQNAGIRFFETGLLRRLNAAEIVATQQTIPSLKLQLKSLGLRVSGRKDELINRLFAANPTMTAQIEESSRLAKPTETGAAIIEEIRSELADEEGAAFGAAIQLIQAGDIQGAHFAWASWFKKQPFFMRERHMGRSPDHTLSDREIERFNSLLNESGQRGALVTAMDIFGMEMRGVDLTAWKRGLYRWELKDLQKTNFADGILINTPDDCGCAAAARISGCWRLNDAPSRLPQDCSSELGCCCGWIAIQTGTKPPTPWRVK